MYLKQLDLRGFKSFAARITFDFGPGITAIVGPNGCGKSNVADALRWVLGEQSGKLLRARKLEDVIFAGSSRRPPAAAAEVSLTLDNSDGWLPLEFTEVVITRKAYRSGESTYLVNRHRSRLRDVADLFLKARTGQSSYAIMGQGLVETILSFRPEERRLLLEEAADLQGYRLKLEEAQQRLAATKENMERVSLLVQELTPHLSHMERQARRASRRASLESDLKGALRSWYGHAWRQVQEALARAQADLEAVLDQRRTAEEQLAQREERLSALRRLVEGHRTGDTPGARRLVQTRERHAHLQQQVNLDRQRHTLLVDRCRELQQELEAMAQERQRLAQALTEAEGREATLRREVASRSDTMVAQEEELASLERELAERRRQAEATDEAVGDARSSVAAAQSRLQGWLEVQYRRPDAGLSALAQLPLAMAQLVELARDYASLRAQARTLGLGIETLEGRRHSLEHHLEEQRSLLDSRRARLHQVDVQLEQLRARLHALGETPPPESSLPRQSRPLPPAVPEPVLPPTSSERSSLWQRLVAVFGRWLGRSRRTAMVTVRQALPPRTATVEPVAGVPGVLATVAELIQIPVGLEKAIIAALADAVEAVVVPSRRDALAVAQAIARQEGPRTILLPLNDIQTLHPPQLLRETGVIGVAANLVRCAERYRPLVNALLGRTIVVEDLGTAQQVLRRGMGSVVTRDGILLQPWGLVASGRRSAAIQRRRDLRFIPRQLQRLERQRNQLEAEVAALTTALSQGAVQLEALRRELAALTSQRDALHATLAQCRQRIGRVQGQIRHLLTARGIASIQKVPSASQQAHLEKEYQRLAAAAVDAEAAAQWERAAVAALAQRRDALAQGLAEARVKAATIEGQLPILHHLRQSHQEALTRLDAQIGQKRSQLQGLAGEAQALERRLRAREEAVARLAQWLSDHEAEAQPQHEQPVDLEGQIQTAAAEAETARDNLLTAERRRLEVEARLQRQREEIGTLRRRLEEDGFSVNDDGLVSAQGDSSVPIPSWLAADGQGEAAGGDPDALGEHIQRLRSQLQAVGSVSPQTEEEYRRTKERHDFLISQMADLQGAERSLRKVIEELAEVMSQRFAATFQQVGEEFQRYFVTFFGGGYAKLILTPPEDYKTSGVEIIAQPPGKRLQSLNMLSGGEKALTAIAFLFALLQTNPSPFCVLDEVDAALDDANVGRFVKALRELSQRTQFIVITHNRRTIEAADRIYGVAMGPDSVSKVLSLQLAEVGR